MRRFIKFSVFAIILLAIAAVCICNSIYNNKYDAYYNEKTSEYLRENFRAGTLLLDVTISTTRTDYDHLGTDISIEHTCNGRPISSGDTIRAKSQLSFETIITEHDDGANDVGSTEGTLYVSAPSYTTRKTVTCKVKERGGTRYKNAYAVWDITYSVSPVVDLDIGYWEVVFS